MKDLDSVDSEFTFLSQTNCRISRYVRLKAAQQHIVWVSNLGQLAPTRPGITLRRSIASRSTSDVR